MFADLFTQTKAPEYVGTRVPYDMAQWDQFILTQLGNIIDLSKYTINVEYKKVDNKKGTAVGSITIKIGDKSAYIPLIIHDFYLQPLDIFYFKDRGFPLRSDLLSEFLSDKLLMLKTVDSKKMFPSYLSIEGKNLLKKFSCTQEEKDLLSKDASDVLKEKINSIPLAASKEIESAKLAFLSMDKIGFDKYHMQFACESDPLLTIQEKELNYKQASAIFEKIGKSFDTVKLPFKVTNPYGYVYPKEGNEPKLELDLDTLTKGGILITKEGNVDSGRIFPLIDTGANLKGKIFIGRRGYGFAKKFKGYKLGRFDAMTGRTDNRDRRPPGKNITPRKNDTFVFIFYLGDKNFAGIPKTKFRPFYNYEGDDVVAMGPFKYLYSKRVGDEIRYYATKNLNILEFIVTDGERFMENVVEKKNDSCFIPRPRLCRLDGKQTDYIASSKEMKNKMALWNPYMKVTKIAEDKFMLKVGGERKTVTKDEKDLILSRVTKSKKKSEEPIFKEILGSEAKKEEKKEKKKEKEGKTEDDKEKTKEAVLKIKSGLDEFLKTAEEVHFDEGVDAALSLNLLTPDRIQKFVNAIPDFERILNLSVDMLLAARLGEKRINPEIIKPLVDKLYSTIEILETLR